MPVLKLNPDEDGVLREDEDSYTFNWEIPDWEGIREYENLVTSQKMVFETCSVLTPLFKTRWLVGLKSVQDEEVPDNKKRFAQLYWQLLDISGVDKEETLSVFVRTNLLDHQGFSEYNDSKEEIIGVGDSIEAKNIHAELEICNWLSHSYRDIVNIFGEARYFLELSIKRPPSSSFRNEDTFVKASNELFRNNFGNLLMEGSDSDLKIVSSDDLEFPVHKLILKAQCSVFAGMLNCDLSESKNGVVKTTDISGETMKILLNYFYTGQLLPNWKNADIIVEFTYAAGKYQMGPVLEMLDDQLRKPYDFKAKATHVDVQLLSLAGKLDLKNAEKRLLQLVIANVKKINKCSVLFELLGIETDEILKTAEEKLGASTVLKVWDCSFGNRELKDVFDSNALLVLAMVQGSSRKIERALLKRFAKSVSEIEEADELFKIIGQE